MDFDPEQLLVALNQGEALEAEPLAQIEVNLWRHLEQELLSADDVYSSIAVLLKLKDAARLPVIEAYLRVHDPLLTSLIIEAVCIEWELADRFAPDVAELARGCSWDEEQDAQVSGLMLAGELLATHPEGSSAESLWQSLWHVFSSPRQANYLRLAAYRGLLRAAGVAKEALPSEFSRLSFDSGSADVNWEALEALGAKFSVGRSHSQRLPLGG